MATRYKQQQYSAYDGTLMSNMDALIPERQNVVKPKQKKKKRPAMPVMPRYERPMSSGYDSSMAADMTPLVPEPRYNYADAQYKEPVVPESYPPRIGVTASQYDPELAASMEPLLSPQYIQQQDEIVQTSLPALPVQKMPPLVTMMTDYQPPNIPKQSPLPTIEPPSMMTTGPQGGYESIKNMQLIYDNYTNLMNNLPRRNLMAPRFQLPRESGSAISPLTNTMDVPTEMNSYRPEMTPYSEVAKRFADGAKTFDGVNVIPKQGGFLTLPSGTTVYQDNRGGITAFADKDSTRRSREAFLRKWIKARTGKDTPADLTIDQLYAIRNQIRESQPPISKKERRLAARLMAAGKKKQLQQFALTGQSPQMPAPTVIQREPTITTDALGNEMSTPNKPQILQAPPTYAENAYNDLYAQRMQQRQMILDNLLSGGQQEKTQATQPSQTSTQRFGTGVYNGVADGILDGVNTWNALRSLNPLYPLQPVNPLLEYYTKQ